MTSTQRPIFRDHVMQRYLQRRQKDVLPHLIAPPTCVFLWLLLGALLIVMAWLSPGLAGLAGR